MGTPIKSYVLALVGKHKITASRAAELLDMSLWDFLNLMHEHNLTLWDDTPEEMEKGEKTLDRLFKQEQQQAKAKND